MWDIWLLGGLVAGATAVGAIVRAPVTSRNGSLRALGLCAFALLAAACNDSGGGTGGLSLKCPSEEASKAPADLSTLSLEDVYKRMAESMTCPGYALHVVTKEESEIVYPEEGKVSYTVTAGNWIDLPLSRARQETQLRYAASQEDEQDVEGRGYERVGIILGDAEYGGETTEEPAKGFQALVCHDSESAVLSLVLNCAGYTEDSTTRLEPNAEYEGRRMPTLVTEGDTSGSDETNVFVRRLYLDANTLLPVLGTSEGTQNNKRPMKSQVTYEYAFVLVDSLPDDFFDPAAIGYVEADPEENLHGVNVGITIYWLGTEFSGAGGLPALILDRAHAAILPPEAPTPRDRAAFDYRLAEEKFGPSVVTLEVYPRSEWDSFLAQSQGRNLWDSPCIQRIEMDLADRRAVVFGGHESSSPNCFAATSTNWSSYVYIGDTVVFVSTSFSQEPGVESARALYSSREGMEAIVRGLVSRPPD